MIDNDHVSGELYYLPEEMHADQADQREDMREEEDYIKLILRHIASSNCLGPLSFKTLCHALRIEPRDVT